MIFFLHLLTATLLLFLGVLAIIERHTLLAVFVLAMSIWAFERARRSDEWGAR